MTSTALKAKEIKREWLLIDLKDKILGRVASEIAQLLQGKHKIYYVPHLDCGDYVVAINAKEIKVSGRKADQKIYYHHSNYPGGLKALTYAQMMAKNPGRIIEQAVINMLPKNKLRAKRMSRLKVFAGAQHSYQDKFKKLESRE